MGSGHFSRRFRTRKAIKVRYNHSVYLEQRRKTTIISLIVPGIRAKFWTRDLPLRRNNDNHLTRKSFIKNYKLITSPLRQSTLINIFYFTSSFIICRYSSLPATGVIILRRMRSTRLVERMAQVRNAYNNSVGKPEERIGTYDRGWGWNYSKK